MKKINETFEQDVIHRNQGNPYITTLPKEGKSHHDIIQQVEQYLSFGKCRVRFIYVCMCKGERLGWPLQVQRAPKFIETFSSIK
jgi:hypothetical protein